MAEEAADALLRAADRLYALPPEGFIAARTALADELRRGGDAEGAKAVRRLARPTAAASLLDRLVRDSPELIHGLLTTGRDLRTAQAELDAARLKALGAERRRRVADAVGAATAIGASSGHPPGPGVVADMTATLTAAVLDEAAGAAVASGRLLAALPQDGLEGTPITALVALPDAPPALPSVETATRRSGAPGPRGEASGAEDRAAAARRLDGERAVADAERARDRTARAAQDAEDDLADAERRRDDTAARVTDLRERITELQQRLDQADDDLRATEREARDRRAEERRARRAAEDAEDGLTAAQGRLDAASAIEVGGGRGAAGAAGPVRR